MLGSLHQPTTLILGLGESGLAMAHWCATYGGAVRIADTRAKPASEKLQKLAELRAASGKEIECTLGAFIPALLDGVDLVGISPGLSPYEPALAALLAVARARDIPVWGEIEFFAQALFHLQEQTGYSPKLLAITGTNGKTTVTQLSGKLCACAGKQVAIAGNISPSALAKLSACIAQNQYPEVWVLELSSFQLATTYSLKPHAAVILNISEDHLDWHPDLDDYIQAKAKIFSEKTIQVLNREDKRVMAVVKSNAPVVTFGTDAPKMANSFGLINERGMTWLAYAEGEAVDSPPRRKANESSAPALATHIRRLMPSAALHIRGRHNASNALASLALARAIDLPLAPLLHGLRDYQGEPHRVQSVAIINEIEYIDDSKGTNVGATLAALDAIGAEKKIILIAGGVGKGQDFSPLAKAVTETTRAVILIGEDAPLIRQALRNQGSDTLLIEHGETLEQAVQLAAGIAQAGEAVLLSPACASFDLFRDYIHRAECFIDAVRNLKAQAGEVL